MCLFYNRPCSVLFSYPEVIPVDKLLISDMQYIKWIVVAKNVYQISFECVEEAFCCIKLPVCGVVYYKNSAREKNFVNPASQDNAS